MRGRRRVLRRDPHAGRRRLRQRRGRQQQEVLGRPGRAVRVRPPGRRDRRQRVLLERRGPQGQGDGRRREPAGHGPDRRVRRLRLPGPAVPRRRPALHPRPGGLPLAAFRRRRGQQRAVRHAVRRLHAAAVLQQVPLHRGRHHPARDLGRTGRVRRGAQGGRGEVPLRAAARPRGGPGRDPPVAAERRRRLHRHRRHLRHRLHGERRDPQLAAGRTRRQGAHRPRRARQARPREGVRGVRRRGRRHAQRAPLPDGDGAEEGREVRHGADPRHRRHDPPRSASPTG